MKQQRNGVFETNSSSTHSITISTNPEHLLDTIIPEIDGTITLGSGDYGWENETYTDARSKADYVTIYIRDWSGPNTEDFKKVFEDLLKAQTGCKEVILDDDGYIDHQSIEDHDLDYMFQDVEQLKHFIFNKGSYLDTGNDNN